MSNKNIEELMSKIKLLDDENHPFRIKMRQKFLIEKKQRIRIENYLNNIIINDDLILKFFKWEKKYEVH